MPIKKQEIEQAFNKTAHLYEQHAFIQNLIGARLMDRLRLMKISFEHILDAGCGTGTFSKQLIKLYPQSQVVGLDFAFEMIKEAKPKSNSWFVFKKNAPQFIQGDLERLPFKESAFDLIFCNLALHWCTLEKALESIKHVLKPGGLLLFTVPGPDTLIELKQAFAGLDDHQHINTFPDMHDIGDQLQRFNFQHAVMDMEKITLEYPSLWALLKDLKFTGVKNIHPDRSHNLTPKSLFTKLEQVYPKKKDKFPMTFEIVYGHGVCSEKRSAFSQSKIIPLSQI